MAVNPLSHKRPQVSRQVKVRVWTTCSFREAGFCHAVALPSSRLLSSSVWFKLSHAQLVRREKQKEGVHTMDLRPRPRNGVYSFHSHSIYRRLITCEGGYQMY